MLLGETEARAVLHEGAGACLRSAGVGQSPRLTEHTSEAATLASRPVGLLCLLVRAGGACPVARMAGK